MKRLIVICALLFCASATAEDFFHYRDNDPFVFCTYGQRAPTKCWIPVSPASGTYYPDPTCNPPNSPYGRPWTQDDYDSLSEYVSICPKALGQGKWTGSGTGEQSPTMH